MDIAEAAKRSGAPASTMRNVAPSCQITPEDVPVVR